MVSVQQFEQQVRARAQAIRQKQQQIRQFKETPKFTQQELRGMERRRDKRKLSPLDLRARRRQVVEVRKEAKKRAQEQVSQEIQRQKDLESTLQQAKEAQNRVERLRADIKAARKVARAEKFTPAALETKRQRQFFVQEQKIIEAEKEFKKFQEQLKEVDATKIEGITLTAKEPPKAVQKVTEVAKGVVQTIGKGAGKILEPVVDLPITTKTSPIDILTGRRRRTTTIGQLSQAFVTAKREVGIGAQEATTAGAKALGLPLEVQAPARRLFPGSPLFPGTKGPTRTFTTLPGLVPKVARAAPEILTFATIPGAIAGVGTEAAVSTKQLKEQDKRFEREITRITQEAQRQPVEEGFRPPTREEVKQQIGPELRASIRQQAELGVGTAVVFGAGLSALRGVRALRQPIIKRTGGEVIPTATDVTALRTQIITPKGPVPFQTVQTRTLRGPIVEERTTKLGQILGLQPRTRIVSSPKLDVAQTPLGQFGQQPFILEQFKIRKGGQPGKSKFSLVTPQGQVQLTAEQVAKAGRIPQFLQQKLAEARAGAPVPRELASKLFGEQDIFGISQAQAQRFGAPIGKTITRQFGVGRERVVQTLPNGIKVFKIDVTAKDVTKPFARATGQPRVLRGTGVQFPAIDITARGGLPPGITSIPPSGGPTTPLSRTFTQQPQAIQTIQAIPVPKVPKPRITKGPTGVVRETAKPSPVATELAPVTREAVIVRDPIPREADAISLGISQATGIGQTQRERQLLRQRQVQDPTQTTVPIQAPIVTQTPIQQPGQTTRQRQRLRQLQQLQFGRPRRVTTTLLTPFGRPPRVPRTPIFGATTDTRGIIGAGGLGIGELVDVFVRRKRRDRKIADDVPFDEAKKILRNRLISTLAASGFIQRNTGQRVFTDLGPGFRPAKNDPLRIVQRRGFRLGTRAEVGEIKTAKRRSLFFR